jgi:excisionase family DNA binding protein
MKRGTGRPPRKPSDKPKLTLSDLGPLSTMTRCKVQEAAVYLRISVPMVYVKIKNGELETKIDGSRRFVTRDSIQRVLDGKPPPRVRAPKFVPIRTTPENGGRRAA